MSSKSKGRNLKEFLSQNGYLLVFTIMCGLGLLSYLVCNIYFEEIFNREKTYVLNTSVVKGVWISSEELKCPEIDNLDIDRCVEASYFDRFQVLDTQQIRFDSNGRILFSNDEIFVSGIFDQSEQLNRDIWPNVYVGDLNIKINDRQWVYESVIWDIDSNDPLLEIFKTDTGYILLFSPSVSMVNRTKRFWVYEYNVKTEKIEGLSFYNDGNKRAFFESGKCIFVLKNEELYLLFERYDPILMGNTEVEIYNLTKDLYFDQRVLLLNGY